MDTRNSYVLCALRTTYLVRLYAVSGTSRGIENRACYMPKLKRLSTEGFFSSPPPASNASTCQESRGGNRQARQCHAYERKKRSPVSAPNFLRMGTVAMEMRISPYSRWLVYLVNILNPVCIGVIFINDKRCFQKGVVINRL